MSTNFDITIGGIIDVNEALYTLSRHRIYARPMSEVEIVESRIEEIRLVSSSSDLLTKAQKDGIEKVLVELERVVLALCPQETPSVPPGLEDFQP